MCSSLRHVLPLAREGRGGDERPPRFRAVRARRRLAIRRRRAVAVADSGNDALGGVLAAIAADVQGRAALASAGVQAEIAGRIADAIATAPRDQLGAILQSLQMELSARLAAIAATAAVESRGRQQAASRAHASARPPQGGGTDTGEEDEAPERPQTGSHQAGQGRSYPNVG